VPRLHPLQTAWTRGELSPKLAGRVDVQPYFSGAETLLNYLVLPQGGIQRRPGTRFVAEVKDSSTVARLVRFEFSVDDAYVLEFGNLYIRFYKDGAQVTSGGNAVEVTTTYAAADLFGLDFVQVADVLYIMSVDYETRKLERYSDTIWKLRTVDFNPPPSFEFGARPSGTVAPGGTSGSQTFTASVASFLNSDVGREIVITGGTNAGARATITGFTGTTQVTATITENFVNTSANAAGNWKITDSPKTILTPGAKDPVGLSTTLTLTAAGWRGTVNNDDSDTGRFVVVNGGQYEITEVTSTTVAQATIKGTASATTAAQSGVWTLEEALWSAANGYAETGALGEDRLWLSAGYRFAGSKTADYENFGVGVEDDDAVIFSILAQQINTIRWMRFAKQLIIGTAGEEFVAKGGADSPITPSNVQVSNETTYGSNGVAPIRVGNVILFLTRSGKKMREFTFNFEADGYVAPDLLLLSEHLSDDQTIVDMAYQREPDSRVWAVRSDGVLLACTYLRDQNVVAWSRCITGPDEQETTPVKGKFESVCVIPHPDGDREQTWVLVNRTIDGATKRFVEYLDDSSVFEDANGVSYGSLHTDCAVT
jgi:hypothetical protein